MGSSPLTRGKHEYAYQLAKALGLIPAHAGKTMPRENTPQNSWAHPRSRGENGFGGLIGQGGLGSSPLTRGKHSHGLGGVVRRGLIPAHAGKTSPLLTPLAYTRAHPRSRGENLPTRRPAARAAWLIPAHAGKTGSHSYITIWCWAHPRSRGENLRTTRPCFLQVGSSPLTRGKHDRAGGFDEFLGLIPAHAGKTRPRRWL